MHQRLVCVCTLERHTCTGTLVSATLDLNGINVLFLGSTPSQAPRR